MKRILILVALATFLVCTLFPVSSFAGQVAGRASNAAIVKEDPWERTALMSKVKHFAASSIYVILKQLGLVFMRPQFAASWLEDNRHTYATPQFRNHPPEGGETQAAPWAEGNRLQ